jgi:hypothetical protein
MEINCIFVPMAQNKDERKRPTIQIVDPDPKLLEKVKKLAEKERRSVSKQAEYMLARYLEQNKS